MGGQNHREKEDGQDQAGRQRFAAGFAEQEFGGQADDAVERQLEMLIDTGLAEKSRGEGRKRMFLDEQ